MERLLKQFHSASGESRATLIIPIIFSHVGTQQVTSQPCHHLPHRGRSFTSDIRYERRPTHVMG
jgi:hypothetical protein